MTGPRRAIPAVFLVLAILAGCAPADPRERILSERARWRVDVLSWAMEEGGKITISVRISGPVRSELKQLTVRVDMLDGQDQRVGTAWRTLDLSDVQRGGPEDVFIRIDAPSDAVEGVSLDTVPDPDPDEISHIPELELVDP